MSAIPCCANPELQRKIEEFAEVLRTQAHKLGDHGLSEAEFYGSGLFRGAIERIRGQFSATMSEKHEFARHVLNYMQDRGFIGNWEEAGNANRHDYTVRLPNGRVAGIELKGCLDGNNTNIFERPSSAQEFILWSVCTNPSADPNANLWSGIHTRLSAEMIESGKLVDGLVVWDFACGTAGRSCPKLVPGSGDRLTTVGPYRLPPPCIYLFPTTVPSVRTNSSPPPHGIEEVGLLQAFHRCFGGRDEELNRVTLTVAYQGSETVRTTMIERDGIIRRKSRPTPIRRR